MDTNEISKHGRIIEEVIKLCDSRQIIKVIIFTNIYIFFSHRFLFYSNYNFFSYERLMQFKSHNTLIPKMFSKNSSISITIYFPF